MWNRKKLIFLFMKVLQVEGIVKEVLVRVGDTIVLNCTCTNSSNGLWDVPNKSASRMKDIDEEQLIPYSHGVLLNPKLNLSNYYIVGSYKNKTCNLRIKNVSSYDEGKYLCQYLENNTTISRFYRLILQTPPDVSINKTNFQDQIYIECHVSGDLGPYTFKDWEHKSRSGKHIRYIENTKDGILVLQKDNYQNSGIYICRVNNSIIDMDGDFYQKKTIFVQYEGPPVFVLNNRKMWFSPMKVNVTLKVFTLSDITSAPTLKRIEQNSEQQMPEVVGSLMNSTCKDHLIFHNVSVKLPCNEFMFKLRMSRQNIHGNYYAKVCNKYGCGYYYNAVISTGHPGWRPNTNTTSLLNNDLKSTFPHCRCWIIMSSLVGGLIFLCICSHVYCCIKRAKANTSNSLQITTEDNYDEVETLNYNNGIFDDVHTDANMNNDNISSIIENNNIMFRADVVSSDDSSSIKQSGDGYENPYQAINTFDIDMNHYSSIVSSNYQNTTLWPPCVSANTPKYLNIAMDGVTNPWLVIYKRK